MGEHMIYTNSFYMLYTHFYLYNILFRELDYFTLHTLQWVAIANQSLVGRYHMKCDPDCTAFLGSFTIFLYDPSQIY